MALSRLAFPIQRECRYQVRGSAGSGETLCISSGGVVFRSTEEDGRMEPGKRIRVSINWPALLGECRLNLVMHGRVADIDGQVVAAAVEGYEFRTAGRHQNVSR